MCDNCHIAPGDHLIFGPNGERISLCDGCLKSFKKKGKKPEWKKL